MSNIDPTKPTSGTALTADVRQNFQYAKDEIEAIISGGSLYAADTGAADAYVVTLDPAPTAYSAGMTLRFKASATNTGASTINVNGLGAKSITKASGNAMLAEDILVGGIYEIVYDGAAFQLQTGKYGEYRRTAAEIAAGVTPTDYSIKPENPLRYWLAIHSNHDTAFQAAVNVAAINGGKVFCDFNATLNSVNLASNVTIDCSGGELTHQANATADMFVASGISNFKLIGGIFDGNKANQTSSTTNKHFLLSCGSSCFNFEIVNLYSTGFAKGSLKIIDCTNVKVHDNIFDGNGKVGWAGCNEIAISGCTGAIVTDNVLIGSFVTGGGNVGIIIEDQSIDVNVKGNYITNYASEYIQILNYNGGLVSANKTPRANIVSNIIVGTGTTEPAGIHLGENCREVNCLSNIVTGIGAGPGIKLGEWSNRLKVDSNIVFDNYSGITAAGNCYGYSSINGNYVFENDTNGIEVTGNASNTFKKSTIKHNLIWNNGKADVGVYGGIKVTSYCDSITISENIAFDDAGTQTQDYGLIIGATGITGITLRDNDFRGNLTGAASISCSKYEVLTIDNLEDDPTAPEMYTQTAAYSLAAGVSGVVWTAPNANYNGRRWRYEIVPDSNSALHYASVSRGRNAANDDVFAITNNSANTTSGNIYLFLEN